MIAPSSKPSLPRAGFLDAVRASGLLTDEQFARAADDLPADARTGRDAAAALVAAGVLTRFQADRLLAGRTGGFVLGPYVIRGPVARGPGGRVFEALHRAMNRPVALRVLPADKARDPEALPGATSNHCFFCWYVLTRGLASGVGGGGGQVGGWTGERPNFRGELLQLGVRRRGVGASGGLLRCRLERRALPERWFEIVAGERTGMQRSERDAQARQSTAGASARVRRSSPPAGSPS